MKMTGTVQFFDEIQGKGYIIPDDGSSRIKFTYRAIETEGYKILEERQRVEFETHETTNGMRSATRIFVISG